MAAVSRTGLLSDLMNVVFIRRFLLLLAVVGAFQWLLSPTRSLPWSVAAEAVIMLALLLHKYSVAIAWLKTGSRLTVFFKAIFVYVVPAVVAWALLTIDLARHYLLRRGYALSPGWATVCATVGALLLARALAGKELALLGRPRN